MSASRRTNDYLTGGRPITPQVGLTRLGSFKLGGQRFTIPVPDSASFIKIHYLHTFTSDELVLLDSVRTRTSLHIKLNELFKLSDLANKTVIFSFKISTTNPTISIYKLAVPVGGYTVQNNVDTVGNITNEFDQPAADYVIEQITDSQERSEPEMTVPEDYAEPDRPAGGDTVPT